MEPKKPRVQKVRADTGFDTGLKGWTAADSGNVCNRAVAKTIRHRSLELAETSPPRGFTNAGTCPSARVKCARQKWCRH